MKAPILYIHLRRPGGFRPGSCPSSIDNSQLARYIRNRAETRPAARAAEYPEGYIPGWYPSGPERIVGA